MSSSRFLKTIVMVAAVAGIYVAAGKLGLSLSVLHENVSFVWPPAGFALAALLLGGFRLWPGIFLGAFLVNALTDVHWAAALGIAVGNTSEAILGALLLRRVVGFQNSMERLRDALGLIILSGLVSTIAAAGIGVSTLCLEGSAAWTSFWHLWFEWWIGDMLGILVLSPFLLTWSRSFPNLLRVGKAPLRTLEAIVLFVLLTGVLQSIFGGWIRPRFTSYLHSYMLFPFLIWAAVRFGLKGATAATLTISAAAIWGTVHGLGPFAGKTPYEGFLILQLFMAVVILTTLVVAASIAERKRSEEVKSDFASMVSHELRTPLSSIKAGIEVVLDGIDGPVTEAQKETLGIAKNNVGRLARLINNVLDYSKLESGMMEMIFERADVTQLLQEVHDLMRLAVQNKGITFRPEFPSAPLFAVCDADKIKQVLINLVDNAIKFTDEGGAISLRLRRSNRQVVIEVEDTGIGIKEEDQEKIFEMFGQSSPIGKTRRGSGIGLAVCRLIIDHHRGRIIVNSAPGEGSRLTVIFPDSLPERKKSVPLK